MGTYLDCINRRIPNRLLIFSVICGAALSAGEQGPSGAVWFFLNILTGAVPGFLLFSAGAFGAGDGKLSAVMAGYLGLSAYWKALLYALLLGAAYGTVKLAVRGEFRGRMKKIFCFLHWIWRTGEFGGCPGVRERGETICFSGAILGGVLIYIFTGGGGIG